MKQYHEILGISAVASLREIKRAARRLILDYHPDAHADNKPYYEERIKEILEAYRNVVSEKQSEDVATGVERACDEPDETGEAAETLEVLLIRLSNRTLALPTRHVREIIRVGDVKIGDAGLMAEAFPFLAGVFQRNGEITMLWNLHSQLGVREAPISSDVGKSKIVVTDWDGSTVGFLVDAIGGMAELRRDEVEEAGAETEYLEGIARTEDGHAGLLSLRKLLYNLPV